MAYAYRKKGRTYYWIGYTDADGVPQQVPTRETRKGDAEELAHELERKAYRERKGLEEETQPDFTFAIAVEKYMASLSKAYASRITIQGNFTNRILPHLAAIRTRVMKPADVRAMLVANESEQWAQKDGERFRLKPASPATREKLRVYVQAVFRYLIEELEHVQGRNPAAGKKMRVAVPKRAPKHLPLAELFRLLQAVPEHRRFHFCFAVGTGIRRSEGLGLEWHNVHEERRFALITKTKTKRDREVPIPPWLVLLIRAARATRVSRFVFPNVDGGRQSRWTKLHRVMKTALKKAGLVQGYRHICRRKGCGHHEEREDNIRTQCPRCSFTLWVEGIPLDLSFKDLRSTFGTLMNSQTGSIQFVQAVLGHGKVATTQLYVGTVRDDLLRHADSVDWGPVAGLALPPGAVSTWSVSRDELTANEVNGSVVQRQEAQPE